MRFPALPVMAMLSMCACGPASSYRNGQLMLVTRSNSDRDGFILSTGQLTGDWRSADLYVSVRLTLSLSSMRGDILCAKEGRFATLNEVPTSTSDCQWGRSITGPGAMLARDEAGGLHRLLTVGSDGPHDFEAGSLTLDVARVE